MLAERHLRLHACPNTNTSLSTRVEEGGELDGVGRHEFGPFGQTGGDVARACALGQPQKVASLRERGAEIVEVDLEGPGAPEALSKALTGAFTVVLALAGWTRHNRRCPDSIVGGCEARRRTAVHSIGLFIQHVWPLRRRQHQH